MRLGVLQVAWETAILWNPLTSLKPQTSEKAETPPPVCELRDVPAALGIFPITLGVQLSHQGIKNV